VSIREATRDPGHVQDCSSKESSHQSYYYDVRRLFYNSRVRHSSAYNFFRAFANESQKLQNSRVLRISTLTFEGQSRRPVVGIRRYDCNCWVCALMSPTVAVAILSVSGLVFLCVTALAGSTFNESNLTPCCNFNSLIKA
jgi:hypothetical protein